MKKQIQTDQFPGSTYYQPLEDSLAKELKDNGFSYQSYYLRVKPNRKTTVKHPILSELIDECSETASLNGDTRFISLENNGAFGWKAIGKHYCAACAKDECPFTRGKFEAIGKTPEEAVAKLWLKLNENKCPRCGDGGTADNLCKKCKQGK